jgi:exodeoxyribonuclease (lambda-induced)
MEQGSPEWFEVRKLKLTASNAQQIANNGKGLETLVTELMAEHYSSAPKEQWSNKDLDRGKELEAVAREMYELQRGVKIKQVGFIEKNEYVGASPDGLVEDDGMIEIKCPADVGHYRIIRDGELEIDPKYIWQAQMELLVAERKWCDLIIYNPNFAKSMLVFRITPDAEKHEKLRQGFEQGIRLIKQQLELTK